MVFRISSLYGHSRKIKVVLLVGFLLHVSSEAILGVLLSPAQRGTLTHRLFPIITIPKAHSFIPSLFTRRSRCPLVSQILPPIEPCRLVMGCVDFTNLV